MSWEYFGKTVVSTIFISINLEIKAQLQTMVNCEKMAVLQLQNFQCFLEHLISLIDYKTKSDKAGAQRKMMKPQSS